MRKMTILKIAAAVLFALWLFFGDGKTSHRFVVLVAVVVGYQVYSRVKTQHAIQEGARLGMIELMQQHDFKPEHQHFHSSGNQVSGVAISKDDPRIVLASAGVPARLFHRSDVLGLASEKGKEKELQFKLLSMTGAGDKQVNKDVYVVDVSVKDLDTPRYKLYFQDAEHMRQWENRLAAWLDMHATA